MVYVDILPHFKVDTPVLIAIRRTEFCEVQSVVQVVQVIVFLPSDRRSGIKAPAKKAGSVPKVPATTAGKSWTRRVRIAIAK